MRKIIYQDGYNHLTSPHAAANGYTFCGLCFQFTEDTFKPSSEPEDATSKATSNIVDCPDCVELIDWCRGVRILKT